MLKRKGRYIDGRSAGFFNSVTSEYIDVKGNYIILYPIDYQKSELVNRKESIYRELPFKQFTKAYQIQCDVEYIDRDLQSNDDVTFEYDSDIVCYVQKDLLERKNISFALDDVVSFGGQFYEVSNVDNSKRFQNSPFFNFAYAITCNNKRLSQTEVELLSDIEIVF